jgi:hypothetical protein
MTMEVEDQEGGTVGSCGEWTTDNLTDGLVQPKVIGR